MRTYKTEGIIIKRSNFGEADRYLTIFTKKSGKIHVKAMGVRKLTSRRSPHIELLNLSRFTLYKGRGVPIVTEAESIADFSLIKDDLTKVGFSYHICELVDGLCPENQENSHVFTLLKNTLEKLTKEDNILGIIHDFEIELLFLLGFWSKTRTTQNFNTLFFIENILERKLKAKNIIPRFTE